MHNFDQHKIILASKSPRRHELLKGMGINFTVEVRETDEVFPAHLKGASIALFLAELKASAFSDSELDDSTIVITADTIVWLQDACLNKPMDYAHAVAILKQLSGNKHTVYTGVCLKKKGVQKSFCVGTDVYFKTLSDAEIDYYIERCKPFDKAGSYGVQEWIGYVAIDRIDGSFYNVMGLPTRELYTQLADFR